MSTKPRNHGVSSAPKEPAPKVSALKAPAVKKGDHVGVVCPASRPQGPVALKRAVALLEQAGFKPVLGAHCMSNHGFSAGTDDERASDFNRFIGDQSIRAIFCLAGGYGSAHLLERIDYDALKKAPKAIVGSDDNSSLLLGINAKCGLVVFHGPNLEDISDSASIRQMSSLITSTSLPAPLSCEADVIGDGQKIDSAPSGVPYSPVGGTISGELVGGNLTALISLFGTGYQPELAGKVLFLEDKNERTDILDRWFTTLYVSGRLETLAGVIFGEFHNCGPKGNYNLLSLEELLGDRLKELNIPSCFGFPFGYRGGAATATVPIGIVARVDMDKGLIEFNEAAVN